ncbi:MAG: alpha/beta hydrolase family protein [Paenibacillaceae bacterium]
MWSPELFLERLYEQTIKAQRESSYDEAWTAKLKTRFKLSLGEFPISEGGLEPVLLERVDMGDYYRQRVLLTSFHPLQIPVYVLIPKEKRHAKLPAVLALHGHGYGSKEGVGLLPDGTVNQSEAGIHNHMAIQLVRRGMVVLAPELVGFGDRRMANETYSSATDNSCSAIGSQLLLMGKTIAGLRVAECQRVIDYAVTLDEVDPQKIGCIGLSGGGLVAAYTSAVEERIMATVICGYTNTFKASIMSRRHCLDNYIPGILQLAEMPELIGLIAPRSLFIESGTDDHLFPVAEVDNALLKLGEIYKQYGAEARLSSDIFPGKHEISGRKSFDWLAQNLL